MSEKIIGGDNSAKIREFIENSPDNEEVLEALRGHEEWVDHVYKDLREVRIRHILLKNRLRVATIPLTNYTMEYDSSGVPKPPSYRAELIKEAKGAGK